jgi:pullulanase/glycogen debranching enzyme
MQWVHPDQRQFLGSRFLPDGRVQFTLWAPGADSAAVELRSESWLLGGGRRHGPFPARQLPGGVWEVVEALDALGLEAPLFYQWTVVRQGHATALLDPWARSCDAADGRQVPWAALLPEAAWRHEPVPVAGEGCDGPGRAVIYEAHIRDLSSDPDGPVPEVLRGTYAGAVWALDRIAGLGVSHLQILPIQLFGRTDETKRAFEDSGDPRLNNYNWGYDPIQYFIPTGWYARDPADPASRVRDLRLLVDEAHRRGLRVILDVVYNHAYATAAWEAMAPGHWFRKDHHGHYRNHSGCGNDFETTHPMFRRMMTESLLWMVEAYDFDGFRFDLMGLIDRESMLAARDACLAVKPGLLFLGEGWRMYDGPPGTRGMDQDAVAAECPIAMFSDEFRDLAKGGGMDEKVKAFLHGEAPDQDFMPGVLRGDPGQRFTARHPWNCVNYLECHDGLTAHDNLAVNLKLDPRRPEQRRELLGRLAIGLFLQAFSQGICFLHAGQEHGRSKPLAPPPYGTPALDLAELHEAVGGFVRNSYRSGDSVNAWRWNHEPDREALAAWCRRLLAIRRQQPAFWSMDRDELSEAFTWHPQAGAVLAWSLGTGDGTFLMMCNASTSPAAVCLPGALAAEAVSAHSAGRRFLTLGGFRADPAAPSDDASVAMGLDGLELPPLAAWLIAWRPGDGRA